MRKVLLFLLALTVLPLCAQTEVNTFFSGANEGITYCLPDTRIDITVKAACITRTPGEFNRYAERYLRVNNAITEAATLWEIIEADVTTSGKPNSEKMYTVKLNNSSACNINLCNNGIIKSINIKEQEESTACTDVSVTSGNHIDATQFMTEEMLQATSTAKLAELTAKEIYAIRESKLAITRGLSENMPKDGQSMQLVLNELDRQEKALTELFTGRISTGVMNDLERVTKQAYGMIAYAGMGDKLPNLCYYNTQEQFQKPYSEKTAELIDNEVKALIAEQYERAKRMLLQYKDGHRQLAELLMEREVIFAEDAERIFGKRPWASRSEEILEPAQEETKVEEAKPAKEETTLQAVEPNDTEGKNDQYQPNNPSGHKSKETSTLSEAPEYSKPTKPKTERTRKPKNDNLFDGFDFDQEKEE